MSSPHGGAAGHHYESSATETLWSDLGLPRGRGLVTTGTLIKHSCTRPLLSRPLYVVVVVVVSLPCRVSTVRKSHYQLYLFSPIGLGSWDHSRSFSILPPLRPISGFAPPARLPSKVNLAASKSWTKWRDPSKLEPAPTCVYTANGETLLPVATRVARPPM